MAGAYFYDLDGTLVKHGTNEFLPGALDLLKQHMQRGDQLFITTRRGDEWSYKHKYGRKSVEDLVKTLEENDIKIQQVVYNVLSPRTIINDDGAYCVNHEQDSSW